jgi:MFS family permease
MLVGFLMVLINTSPRAKLIVFRITGNAVIFGFAKDIKLKGKEFNNLVTLFYVTYIVFDIPWVVCIKRYGANRILGIALLGWSAATLGTGFVHNYHQALACRLLLGFFEAGLLPCMVFIISTIWNKKQQGKRIAVIYCATTVSGAFGGLFAYGVQQMGHKHGLEAWRWLFIIEGIISFVVGGLCWITMPYSAEKAWFLNKEQSELMLLKKQRDLLYKGEDEFKAKHAWAAATDPLVYLVAFSLFSSSLPLLGFGTFLPTIIRGLGYAKSLLQEKVRQSNSLQIHFDPSKLPHDSCVRACHCDRGSDGLVV